MRHRSWKDELIVEMKNGPFVDIVFGSQIFELVPYCCIRVSLPCFRVCFTDKRTQKIVLYYKRYFKVFKTTVTSFTKLITNLWMVSGKFLNNQWYLEMLV